MKKGSAEKPASEHKAKKSATKTAAATEESKTAQSSALKYDQTDGPFATIVEATPTADFPGIFDALAEVVINKYALNVCGHELRLREIEFYVNHPNHPDKYTHSDVDQKRPGCWYFHKTGKSYRGGTYKGLDISIGSNAHFGGILIRSLQDKATGEVVEGSCLCVDHIIKLCKTKFAELDGIAKIVEHAQFKEKVMDKSGIIHLEEVSAGAEKFKYYKGPRVGLGAKHPEYLNKLYRYVVLPAKMKKGKDTLVAAMLESGMDKREVQRLTNSTLAVMDKIADQVSKAKTGKTKDKK